MEKVKLLLKILLPLSIISSLFHLYISFFLNDLCFWNKGIIFGLADFLNPYTLSSFLFVFLLLVITVFWKMFSIYREVFYILAIPSLTNILDRLMHGGVCDYINIKVFFNFPIFNLNDIFISIALIIILFVVLYDSTYSEKGGS